MKKKKALIIGAVLTFFLVICNTAWAGYSISISKATNKLALYKDDTLLRVMPVATGMQPSDTPEGTFKIIYKLVDPYYSKEDIPGGTPENPLGARWLGLDIGGGDKYGIHGTNNPSSIGTYASAGCIRMYNNDVIWLSNQIPAGTPVTINNKPIKKPQKSAPVQLIVNNENVTKLNEDTQKQSDDMMLPLRATAEKLGYKVTWNSSDNTVALKNSSHKIEVNPRDNKGIINDNSYELNTELINNHLYIAVRFFDSIPDTTADWDRENKKITINN